MWHGAHTKLVSNVLGMYGTPGTNSVIFLNRSALGWPSFLCHSRAILVKLLLVTVVAFIVANFVENEGSFSHTSHLKLSCVFISSDL